MNDEYTFFDATDEPLRGIVRVPGDKSISHRSIIFASMADGISHVSGVLDSDDVRSTVSACRALGAKIDLSLDDDGCFNGTVEGWGSAGPSQPDGPIDCGNSGTTTRLMMGVIAPWDISVRIEGDQSLSRRPMARVSKPLEQMGARFEFDEGEHLPLTITGTRSLKPIVYSSPHASAQVKTAILLAGIFCDGTTALTEPSMSRTHTEDMLPQFGVEVTSRPCFASVEGPQSLTSSDVTVSGDPSSAAFFACAAALSKGADVTIDNVCLSPTRIGFVDVLRSMGADIACVISGACGSESFGSITVRYAEGLHGTSVEASKIASMVDEVPVLALVSAFAQGHTVFHDVSELRVKETNRLDAIIDGLANLGVHAWAEGDDLHIEGGEVNASADLRFDSLGDHRLAMTWSLLAFACGIPVGIKNFESVSVSFPNFESRMKELIR